MNEEPTRRAEGLQRQAAKAEQRLIERAQRAEQKLGKARKRLAAAEDRLIRAEDRVQRRRRVVLEAEAAVRLAHEARAAGPEVAPTEVGTTATPVAVAGATFPEPPTEPIADRSAT